MRHVLDERVAHLADLDPAKNLGDLALVDAVAPLLKFC